MILTQEQVEELRWGKIERVIANELGLRDYQTVRDAVELLLQDRKAIAERLIDIADTHERGFAVWSMLDDLIRDMGANDGS